MIRAALTVVAKDLRQRIRDRSVFVLAIMLPLGLAFILNMTLGNAVEGELEMRFAYADEDHGALAASLRNDILASMERDGIATITDAPSQAAAQKLVDDGSVSAALVVPAGFSQAVQQGGAAQLRVIGDVDETLRTDIARSIAEGYASSLDAVRISIASVMHDGSTPDPATVAQLAQRAAAQPDPVKVDDITATRRELDVTSYFSAGLAVFFLFFTVQFGVSSLLDERKEGTLARLLAAPVPRAAILGGKLLTSFAMGLVSMAVLVVATSLLLGANWGAPLGVAALVVAGVLSAMAVMALVATLAKTAEQAGNWQSIIAIVLGMLGGSFFPIAQAGGTFEKLSYLTPHAWFLRGLGDLSGGAGAVEVLPAAGAMLLFAVVVGALASIRMPRMAEP